MRVTLRGESLSLTDNLLVGEGGEARVYKHPKAPLALKVYLTPETSAPKDERTRFAGLMQLRASKLVALLGAARLPDVVVRPEAALTDPSGKLVGYAMPLVDNPLEIGRLARPDRALDANAVLALFRALGDAIETLHGAGIVVGDLNDGNVLLARGDAPRLIDVDSFQIGALPCPVAHERFLDPRLYGVDLSKAPRFSPLTDAYALRVMLCQTLLFVHPYGGVHPKHGTLLRRAEARHSIFRGDVQIPRRAQSPDTLPDALRDDLERAFDKDERTAFSIPHASFVRCSCGAVHGRSACPACRVVVQKPSVRISGVCVAETVVEARSAVLAACMSGGRLLYLVDDDGIVRREDRATVFKTGRGVHTRFGIANDRTWVEHGGALVCMRGEVEAARTRADAWCTAHAGLFVLDGDSVIHHETGARVARVLPNVTQLFGSAGDTAHAGLALYRAGNVLRGMWFGRGVPTDLDALPVSGRVADIAVSFGDERALVGVALDDAGVRTHALFLLDARGKLLASQRGRPDEAPILGTVRGFCLAHGKVLAPTSDGVIAYEPHVSGAGTFAERARFAGTEGFVDASSELLAAPGGELVVVDARSIVKLRMVRSS